MKNNLSVIYAFTLIVGDFLALLSAFVLAYIFRVTLDPRPLVNEISALDYLQVWFLLTPVWLIIFALLGLYSRRVYDYRWREIVALLVGSTLGIMVVITYDFATNATIFPARLIKFLGRFCNFFVVPFCM